MKKIDKHCEGYKISTQNKHTTHTKYILVFFDDRTHYSNDWERNNIKTIIKHIQHAAQSWEELLHTSGGKLKKYQNVAY